MNNLIATGNVESLAINGKEITDVTFSLDGPVGDTHSGFARELSSHDNVYIATSDLEKGAFVFNWRTWTGVSSEEVSEIERLLGYNIPVGCLLENIALSGISHFSKLEPGTRLVFPSSEKDGLTSQAVLAVWEENGPCRTVGERLAKHHGVKGMKTNFIRESQNKRGVMGFVLSSGTVSLGDQVLVYPPVR